MRPPRPTVLVSRRPRGPEAQWRTARSWLGGAPRLGSRAWPTGRDGTPLHFAAQIDLAELSDAAGPTGLPTTGSLAFFFGANAVVIHVPDGAGASPTLPPEGTPDLTQTGASSDWPVDPDGRPLYPYWPLRLDALDLAPPPEATGDEDDDEALETYRTEQLTAIDRVVPRRSYDLSAALAFAGPPIPDWWQNAMQLARDLGHAAECGQGALGLWRSKREDARAAGDVDALAKAAANVALLETELARLKEQHPGFGAFVTEVVTWTQGRDPFAVMSPGDLARLEHLWSRNSEFPRLTGYYGRVEIERALKPKMLEALPSIGTPEFAALPIDVQALIRAHRAPRPMRWHSAIVYAQCLSEARIKGPPGALKRVRWSRPCARSRRGGPSASGAPSVGGRPRWLRRERQRGGTDRSPPRGEHRAAPAHPRRDPALGGFRRRDDGLGGRPRSLDPDVG